MDIYALVGPSGTGKSHRALQVAHKYEVELIIDDGLLIKGDRILAGLSAKRQATRLAAIKTSLFLDPQQAHKVKLAIQSLNPQRILILGTSVGMVEKIVEQLALPPPIKKIINIEDEASLKEIRKARQARNQFSKHVIPAPVVEVKKAFPGTIIDPIKVFLQRKDAKRKKEVKIEKQVKQKWQEQAVVRPTFTFYGKLTIERYALEDIVRYAAKELKELREEVKSAGKINILNHDDGSITIELFPTLFYGHNLTKVSRTLQQVIINRVEEMTGLLVKAVNIHVKEISLEHLRKEDFAIPP